MHQVNFFSFIYTLQNFCCVHLLLYMQVCHQISPFRWWSIYLFVVPEEYCDVFISSFKCFSYMHPQRVELSRYIHTVGIRSSQRKK
ncbi:hypothetical protein PHAVU_001G155100 [Phaseolus vulgaris]|uniref:Secreted protein n=1 Tax=Phaseolus vulgaris TaxID=3885 RepID=V7CWF9_PHAVU|nr:hypothetical protein PHAVU_001G155100g [Phaseolus vulgaris]ESW34464.1 hypothetical protein PHAVU_001G155100g [Phaseolus vulgaris]